MNQRSFVRKVAYLAAIVVLLVPLSLLSMPAREGGPDDPGSAGGVLSRMRQEYDLSQNKLGRVDTSSETMKLATLGLRSIAITYLSSQANDRFMRKDWLRFSNVLDQIIKLEPHIPAVWSYQGWNKAYNISVEFDDYRDRYTWVTEGIRFLKDGTQYNPNSVKLHKDLAWTVSHKIGVADEKAQYRRLFRQDDDFFEDFRDMLRGDRSMEQRDNWLVGHDLFRLAEDVAKRTEDVENMNPVVFYSQAPMCRIKYAEALEQDGVFEERAGVAWKLAHRDWIDFGGRELRSAGERMIRLNDADSLKREIEDLKARFDALPPTDRREKIFEEKFARLTPAQREVMEKFGKKEELTEEEHGIYLEAQPKLAITFEELSKRVDAEHRDEARAMAARLADLEQAQRYVDIDRNTSNYAYWMTRCEMEQRDDTLAARRELSLADKAFQVDQDLLAAKKHYEDGFRQWSKVLDEFPSIRTDDVFDMEMMETINRYETLLKRLDETLPTNFPLQDIVEKQRRLGR